ncbi:Uncharacterised protein [Mycobacteroides abscessus subsp. bolletii]|uniref:hypothetical protein n=1 Tax=Mycobacteroides abscessus TaxID=36809 RepID=UPI000925E910|nr:hypothetical protein [Mycobacteroides abscessus]SIK89422.1 Uncharacterised protein [Mycobacteroides abscessus subsp. bolletii]SKS49347.1 Uncharacterised protein [Mycobacteroides abscessus subsp. bolletii]SKY53744.1 Uncharacterised protein [Mycobacteroides abscessus subsp. bolletii]SLD69929.1 Uncharacterised protein [Mycobacteroides abscessus subsp. bolletii]
MNSDSNPDELQERDDLILDPGTRERLRSALAGWRGPSILYSNALADVVAKTAKLTSFSLPQSVLNRASILSGIEAHRLKLMEAVKPTRDIQIGLSAQLADRQAHFAKLSANLTKTIDIGISDSVARVAKQFAAEQASWLKTLGPTLERMTRGLYPPNLREIEDLEFGDVERVVMDDGIALYGVPRTPIAKALINADTAARRRDTLGRRWSEVSADCRKAVERLASDVVAPYAPFALAALDALDNSHTEAAQALTGSLVDNLLTRYFGEDRKNYVPDRNGKRTTKAYDEFTVHQFIVFAPMWRAYQQYHNGDPVPSTFSRHATAHTVSPRQFNRRNAVQGLLFATSLLLFFDEQARRLANN